MNQGITIESKSLLKRYNNLFAKEENISAELIYKNVVNPNNLISVIVPTYNRFDLLKEAITSINESNSFNYVIVIVDNCSDTNVSRNIEEYIIENNFNNLILYRCLSHSNSWNMALYLCQSTWVVMLHDDDLLNQNYFNEITLVVKSKPEASIVSVASDFLVQTKIPTNKKIYNRLYELVLKLNKNSFYLISKEDLLYFNFTPNTGMIFNREKAINIDGFHTDFTPIPDYVFAFKMAYYYGHVYFYNKVLTKFRLRENSGSTKSQKTLVKMKLNEFRVAINELNINHKLLDTIFVKLFKFSNSDTRFSILKKLTKILAFTIEFLYMSNKFLFKKLNNKLT
jgi:glycosyltransferase involved in cell wall biosynthesis